MYTSDQINAYPRLSHEVQAIHDRADAEQAFFENLNSTIPAPDPEEDVDDAHPLLQTSLAGHAAGRGCRWRLDLIRRRAGALEASCGPTEVLP